MDRTARSKCIKLSRTKTEQMMPEINTRKQWNEELVTIAGQVMERHHILYLG